jgi:hypothetical protein
MKTGVRRILWGVLLASLGAVAAAADKRIPLSGGETMIVSWNAEWVVAEPEDADPDGTVQFHGGNRDLWNVTIAPLPLHPSLTGDTGNLRIYVRTMVRALENGNVAVDHEQRTLEGGSAKGFYVKAHDVKAAALAESKGGGSPNKPKTSGKPESRDYADGYVGAISIGGRPYVFEVLWNAGGEKPATAALNALRTLRIQ